MATTKLQQKNPNSVYLSPISSIIGEGDSFNGEFSIKGSIRIDGIFRGSLHSEAKIIVGESGHVYTSIHAKIVIVSGKVDGNIYATESVHLLSNAQIKGDIYSPKLIMESDVILEGRVKVDQNKVL